MQVTDPDRNARTTQIRRAGIPATLLFLLATASLTLTSLAYEPGIAPPLIAFAAMVALTHQLGRRLYGDITYASGNRN